ncbi:hypothetical protein [Streptomyces sp. A5-4]|uniref:hypothetical protein n=1 Tax=Streptomyces sp. A5-4 TaxID=3384771 RepID=UPI003DA7C5DD
MTDQRGLHQHVLAAHSGDQRPGVPLVGEVHRVTDPVGARQADGLPDVEGQVVVGDAGQPLDEFTGVQADAHGRRPGLQEVDHPHVQGVVPQGDGRVLGLDHVDPHHSADPAAGQLDAEDLLGEDVPRRLGPSDLVVEADADAARRLRRPAVAAQERAGVAEALVVAGRRLPDEGPEPGAPRQRRVELREPGGAGVLGVDTVHEPAQRSGLHRHQGLQVTGPLPRRRPRDFGEHVRVVPGGGLLEFPERGEEVVVSGLRVAVRRQVEVLHRPLLDDPPAERTVRYGVPCRAFARPARGGAGCHHEGGGVDALRVPGRVLDERFGANSSREVMVQVAAFG